MTSLCLSQPVEILLIEDSPTDAKLIAKVLEQVSQPCNLRVVTDGLAAMKLLLTSEKSAGNPLPNLILLDLHLPKKDGIAVLAEIKSNSSLAAIPVIMLTASDHQQDIQKCYEQEANCYLVKPRNLTEFSKIVHELQDFWLEMVRLPTN